MYINESAFKKALIAKLKKSGLDTVCIESHGTGNGIPDMFVQGYGKDFWIEVKNDKTSLFTSGYKVKWRPGQQAWMLNYLKRHLNEKNGVTIIAFADGYAVVRHVKFFAENFVDFTDPNTIALFTKDQWSKVDMLHELMLATNNINYDHCSSYRDCIGTFAMNMFGSSIMDLDWDLEVLYNSAADQLARDYEVQITEDVDEPCTHSYMKALERYLWNDLREVWQRHL